VIGATISLYGYNEEVQGVKLYKKKKRRRKKLIGWIIVPEGFNFN
jgi:hypothetical protein